MWRLVFAFVVFCCFPAPLIAAETDQSIEGVRIGRTAGRSRVVLDLSGPVQYRVRKLESPTRYVVDFEDTKFKPRIDNRIFANSAVAELQWTSNNQIIFVMAIDSVEMKSFPLKPFEDNGFRLVFDFYTAAAGEGNVEGTDTAEVSIEDGAGKLSSVVLPDSKNPDETKVTDSPVSATTQSGREVNDHAKDTIGMGFSGSWEQEWGVTTGGESQKFEALIEPRWDARVNQALSFTAIGRVRIDGVGDLGPDEQRPDNYSGVNGPLYNNRHGEISIRELYFDYNSGSFFARLGKQQVVWGQADGIKVLDVINPQSFREFILDDFDDSRIPLWMINLEHSVGENSSVQALWIPDTSYHELAEVGSPYFLTSPRLVPSFPPGSPVMVDAPEKPDSAFSDSDVGLRFTSFVNGWDLSLNYLYHYQDTPVYYQDLDSVGVINVSPQYERNNLLGGTVSNAFGELTLRGELAYSTDTFHISTDQAQRGIVDSAELASVLGLDWQLTSDTLISTQWFYSRLLDYRNSIIRGETEQIASLLFQSDYYNSSWQFRMLALYSLNDEDSLVQLKLKYWVRTDIQAWLGVDIFSGDQRGLFGQFKEEDRFLLGFEYGF